MNLSELRSSLPDHAKDLRLNLESVLAETGAPGLSAEQIGMVAIASAIASRHLPLTAAIEAEFAPRIEAASANGARAAAAIMGMTNIYYRFLHLVENPEYETLRAGLRMNVLANPGCDKAGFELAAIAVSAINGCGKCIASHEKVLRAHGIGAQGVQSAVRIAAVMHAVAVVLEQKAGNPGAFAAAA